MKNICRRIDLTGHDQNNQSINHGHILPLRVGKSGTNSIPLWPLVMDRSFHINTPTLTSTTTKKNYHPQPLPLVSFCGMNLESGTTSQKKSNNSTHPTPHIHTKITSITRGMQGQLRDTGGTTIAPIFISGASMVYLGRAFA